MCDGVIVHGEPRGRLTGAPDGAGARGEYCSAVATSPSVEAQSAGRAALQRGAWEEARASFDSALREGESAELLEGLSWAAWWLDDVTACLDARERAFRLYRRGGDLRGAARMALWLGDDHFEFFGDAAVSSGWFARAARILEGQDECAEHGWLLVFQAHDALNRNETSEARRYAAEARDCGRRLGVVDIEMFALALEGLALVDGEEVDRGLQALDEAAASALAGEYENLVPAGWTCCYLLSACERVRDFRRAEQWCRKVDAFSRRLRIQFVNGTCRAHLGAILTWRGELGDAERELTKAAADLTERRPFWRTEAFVRLADLRRRQGRLDEAEALLAQAERHPLFPLVLAEVRLDRGDLAGARDVLEGLLRRLPAAVATKRAAALELLARVEAAAGEPQSASRHAEELRRTAEAVRTIPLQAAASFSEGLAAFVAGDLERARDAFDDAVQLYGAGGIPLEAGRSRLELARVLHALGRAEAAGREARAAVDLLTGIGAAAEAERARALVDRPREAPLTARQLEVVRLVAEGLSNREIAARLTLSEHTVHRHLANAYSALQCSTRAAAVARAGQLGLL
jgi:LuxR family transcriptional regulator, maltose regulon positive regulatory protein